MKKIFFFSLLFSVLCSATLFAQPGENKGWPSAERYSFLNECIKTASAAMSGDSARFYCYCMQEKVEKKYPDVKDAAKLSQDDMQTPEWKKEINNCLGGTWSSKDRSDFLTNCVASAKDGIGAEKAKTYCECMLFKIEQRYPSSDDAAKLTAEDLQTPAWKIIAKGCLDF